MNVDRPTLSAPAAAAGTERVAAGRPGPLDAEAGRKISQLVFSQMLEGMLPRSGTSGMASDVWRSMLAAEFGRAMSECGVDVIPRVAIDAGATQAKGGQP